MATAVGVGTPPPDEPLFESLDVKQDYERVLEFSSSRATPIDWAAVSIFSWGGMHMENARRILGERSKGWLSVCENIRDGKLNRVEAYRAFQELRRKRNGQSRLPGVGPAYWTKLIHFLMPRDRPEIPPGYILDQWAGASINMICKRDVVRINRHSVWLWKSRIQRAELKHSAVVSELTSADEYEEFCRQIEGVASHLRCSTEEVDCAFMSGKRGPWRDYLRTNYLASHG
ncbi:hypothetical protein [Minwuia thermotolerans]|uniref:Uncharacterized protein n=1 Tax=Minwuia thermotolerans TaxID=2056226 RepID=A0A2M9G098_9PROT|nr:hypothetical protein [Minwuia thermotolerans]PJK29140.1 hypothetical protein CVT23_13155 [Minwuia thermotolerans]